MKAKDIVQHGNIILNYINKIVPKKNNRIIFYSNLGFRDNVKAVYDYMIHNQLNKEFKIICSCNDYKKYKNSSLINVKFVSTVTGVLYFLTSKYFFYSFGKYPIVPSSKQIVVNLWHGTPLKTIGAFNKTDIQKKQDYFSYVLAASPYFLPVMAQSFSVDKSRVLICGHGRNDKLFEDTSMMKEYFQIDKYNKTFIWLPTFRKQSGKHNNSLENVCETKLTIFSKWNLLKNLNDYLLTKNSLCIIKLHPLQEWEASSEIKYSNIIFYTHQRFDEENLDLYKVLSISDALITDYSSVYFDYLLLNRPIAFTIEDLSEYSNKRGFIFDKPLEFMPGPKIQNQKEFISFLENCLNNVDEYIEEREKVNNICNFYKDGKNSERILKMTHVIK